MVMKGNHDLEGVLEQIDSVSKVNKGVPKWSACSK